MIKTKRLKHPYFLVCYSFFNSSFCNPLDTLYVLLGKVFTVYKTNLITTCVPQHRCKNVVDSQGPVEWVHNKFWPMRWHISLPIRVKKNVFFTTSTNKENVFQSPSWKRHCVTHWHEQRGLDSYYISPVPSPGINYTLFFIRICFMTIVIYNIDRTQHALWLVKKPCFIKL